MMSRASDFDKLLNLKDGGECFINYCEGGGAEVYRCNGMFLVFQVPPYGGEGMYNATLASEEEVLELVYSWT